MNRRPLIPIRVDSQLVSAWLTTVPYRQHVALTDRIRRDQLDGLRLLTNVRPETHTKYLTHFGNYPEDSEGFVSRGVRSADTAFWKLLFGDGDEDFESSTEVGLMIRLLSPRFFFHIN